MPATQRIVQVCLFLVGLWLGYLTSELVFPVIIAVAHWATHRHV